MINYDYGQMWKLLYLIWGFGKLLFREGGKRSHIIGGRLWMLVGVGFDVVFQETNHHFQRQRQRWLKFIYIIFSVSLAGGNIHLYCILILLIQLDQYEYHIDIKLYGITLIVFLVCLTWLSRMVNHLIYNHLYIFIYSVQLDKLFIYWVSVSSIDKVFYRWKNYLSSNLTHTHTKITTTITISAFAWQ